MKISTYSAGLLAALVAAMPLLASASVYRTAAGPNVSYGGVNSGMSSSASMYYGGSSGYYGSNTMGGTGSMGYGTGNSGGMYGGGYYQQPGYQYQIYWCNGYYSYSPCAQQYWPMYYQDPYYSYYYEPMMYYDYYDYYPYDYQYNYWSY